MSVSPCRVALKSYVSDVDEAAGVMRTEMFLNPDEFSDYQVILSSKHMCNRIF